MGFSIPGVSALPFVGDVLDHSEDRRARKDAANQFNESMKFGREQFAFQKDLAKMGVRWRVEDAEAAGLHPLSALGVSPGSASPVHVSPGAPPSRSTSFNRMGQNLQRAIRGSMTAEERALHNAQLRKLAAEADREAAMAQYYTSEAARNLQSNNGTSAFPSTPVETFPLPPQRKVQPVPGGFVSPRAPDQFSRSRGDSSRRAGSNAAWSRYEVSPGEFYELPSEEMSEILESNPVAWLFSAIETLRRNKNRWLFYKARGVRRKFEGK